MLFRFVVDRGVGKRRSHGEQIYFFNWKTAFKVVRGRMPNGYLVPVVVHYLGFEVMADYTMSRGPNVLYADI